MSSGINCDFNIMATDIFFQKSLILGAMGYIRVEELSNFMVKIHSSYQDLLAQKLTFLEENVLWTLIRSASVRHF